MEAFARNLLEEIRNEPEADDARPVQIHFNAFPILGVPAWAGDKKSRDAKSHAAATEGKDS